MVKSGAVEPHLRVSNWPPTQTASHFLNNLFTKIPAERFNVFTAGASILTTSVRRFKGTITFVVLTVCLVLGHAGRPARGALHVYGVRDGRKKSLEKIQRFRGKHVCPPVVLTVCLVLGHERRPVGGAFHDLGVGRSPPKSPPAF